MSNKILLEKSMCFILILFYLLATITNCESVFVRSKKKEKDHDTDILKVNLISRDEKSSSLRDIIETILKPFTTTCDKPTPSIASGSSKDNNGCPTIALINEFHYQNLGADFTEFVEIAHKSSYSLAGHKIFFYDGQTGMVYKQTEDLSTLSLSISNEAKGTGYNFTSFAVYEPTSSLIDSVGGIALAGPDNSIIDFISYGAQITANDGPAAGSTSFLVPVFEGSTSAPQSSLQLNGIGYQQTNFTWVGPELASPGLINKGQSITCPTQNI